MITRIIVGKFLVNCYLFYLEDKKCAIIDPGADAETIKKRIEMLHLKPELVICTHGHFDHITGAKKLKQFFPNIQIAIHSKEKNFLGENALKSQKPLLEPFLHALYHYSNELKDSMPKADILLKHGDKIFYDELKVLYTPGHSPGSICLHNEKRNFIFSGDTIFTNGVGRTDFIGGDFSKLQKSIYRHLINLDDYLMVYPGHGESGKLLNIRRYISI